VLTRGRKQRSHDFIYPRSVANERRALHKFKVALETQLETVRVELQQISAVIQAKTAEGTSPSTFQSSVLTIVRGQAETLQATLALLGSSLMSLLLGDLRGEM
jgi:hypothetical protein